MTALISSKQISAVSIIALQIFLSFRRVTISLFAFFFFTFFFYTLFIFMPFLLLVLSYNHTKKKLPKDHRQSHKCSKITLIFSSFIAKRDIRLTDTPVSVQIGVRQLTNIIFIKGVGNSIINILLIQRRFLLNIAEADRANILINYRAASAD